MTRQIEIHQADCVTTVQRWANTSSAAGLWQQTNESGEDVERMRPNLIFADPPYNQDVSYINSQRDCLSDAGYEYWSARWIAGCSELLLDGGSMWVLISENWADVVGVLLSTRGLKRRRWVIWSESFGMYRADNFGKCARHLLYYVKPGRPHTWNPDGIQVESGRSLRGDKRAPANGQKIMTNVWDIPRVAGTHKEKVDWPNQVPLELLRRVVSSTSNPGDLVLDPFCGSGSTAEACLMSNRRFIGIDASPEACAVSRARLDRARERANRNKLHWSSDNDDHGAHHYGNL